MAYIPSPAGKGNLRKGFSHISLKPTPFIFNHEDWEDSLPTNKFKKKSQAGGSDRKTNVVPEKVPLKPTRFIYNPADWEDCPPLCKAKKNLPTKLFGSALKNSGKKTAESEKVILKATPFVFNPADWEESPPNNKAKKKNIKFGSTGKGSVTKSIVPAKVSASQTKSNYFLAPAAVKATKKQSAPSKTARKELFSGEDKTSLSPLQIASEEKVETPKSHQLSKRPPLICLNGVKLDSLQGTNGIKKELGISSNQTSNSVKESANKKITNGISSSMSSPTNTINSNSSLVSPDENEFIRNEKNCQNSNENQVSNKNLAVDIKRSTNDGNKEIYTILKDNSKYLKDLQQKFTNFQNKFSVLINEFQGEMEQFGGAVKNFHSQYAGDLNKVPKILQERSEDFRTDLEWDTSAETIEATVCAKSPSAEVCNSNCNDLKGSTILKNTPGISEEQEPFEMCNIEFSLFNQTKSPTETEFIQNEKLYSSSNDEQRNNIKFTHNGSEIKDNLIRTISEDCPTNLDEKFTNLQKKLSLVNNEFQGDLEQFQADIKNYQKECIRDLKKVVDTLEDGKENFVINSEWDISAEASETISCSEVPSTVKRTVTFNLKSAEKIEDRSFLEDNGLQKSISYYNSLRERNRQLLVTPKMNRSCLQTPRRTERNRNASLSRKIQKQCLMLVDTPIRKK